MDILDSTTVTAREYLYNNINFDTIYVSKESEDSDITGVISYHPSELLVNATNALRVNENPVLKETNSIFFFSELDLKPNKSSVIGGSVCAIVKDGDCLDYKCMYLIMLTDSERYILDEMLGVRLEENMVRYATAAEFVNMITDKN